MIGFNPTRSTSPCYITTHASNNTCTKMNLSTVKWAQWDKTQSRELLGPFTCVCIALCTLRTILHRRDVIIFPLRLGVLWWQNLEAGHSMRRDQHVRMHVPSTSMHSHSRISWWMRVIPSFSFSAYSERNKPLGQLYNAYLQVWCTFYQPAL